MRTYITLVLVIIIGIASLWFQEDSKEKQEQLSEPSERLPDYFMENFSVTNMGASGQPSYTLAAKKMRHFADDDSVELDQPLIEFKQNGKSYSLQSTRAVYLKDQDLVYLYDNVIIHRKDEQQKTELSIYTDYLKIDTASEIAENEHPSRITTAQSELNTVGLVIDNMKGRLILKSDVEGVYKSAP